MNKVFSDQDFSPKAVQEQLDKINSALFGFDVPDYVQQPTDENPYPPIKQKQAKNPDGSPKVDRFGQPIMEDILIHKPGLITMLDNMNSRAHGVEPAGEGDTVNPRTLSNTHPGAVDTNRVPISTDVPGTEAHPSRVSEASTQSAKHTPDNYPQRQGR